MDYPNCHQSRDRSVARNIILSFKSKERVRDRKTRKKHRYKAKRMQVLINRKEEQSQVSRLEQDLDKQELISTLLFGTE